MRWYIKWTAIALALFFLSVAVYDNLVGLTKTVSATVMEETDLPIIIIDAGHGG